MCGISGEVRRDGRAPDVAAVAVARMTAAQHLPTMVDASDHGESLVEVRQDGPALGQGRAQAADPLDVVAQRSGDGELQGALGEQGRELGLVSAVGERAPLRAGAGRLPSQDQAADGL